MKEKRTLEELYLDLRFSERMGTKERSKELRKRIEELKAQRKKDK